MAHEIKKGGGGGREKRAREGERAPVSIFNKRPIRSLIADCLQGVRSLIADCLQGVRSLIADCLQGVRCFRFFYEGKRRPMNRKYS